MLYVADSKKGLAVELKSEISEKEKKEIFKIFSFTKLHHQISEIKNLVLENGNDFKTWMSETDFQKCHKEGMSVESLILRSNKLVFNYASSIRAYIDIEKRILSRYPQKKEHFRSLFDNFYDNHMEFRFWINFRNYIVHCAMPYTTFVMQDSEPCQIVCSKKHLLEFNHWRESKPDIEAMPEKIDLVCITDTMSSLILSLFLDFYALFAKDIVSSINKYGEFCRKYNVQRPVIIEMPSLSDFSHGQLHPLPVKKLYEAFDVLKSNPNIKINIDR